MPKFADGLTEFNYQIEGLPHDDVMDRRIAALEEVQDANLHSLAVALYMRFPHWLMPNFKSARRFCRLIFYRLQYTEAPIQSSMSHWDRLVCVITTDRKVMPDVAIPLGTTPPVQRHPWSISCAK